MKKLQIRKVTSLDSYYPFRYKLVTILLVHHLHTFFYTACPADFKCNCEIIDVDGVPTEVCKGNCIGGVCQCNNEGYTGRACGKVRNKHIIIHAVLKLPYE